jgi:hypothetical protein
MAERATILVPDISGFTGFTGATEIDLAAHIITELLELIVASFDGERRTAPARAARRPMPAHVRELHQRLRVIEWDTLCQCGACQTASNLTLKFIAHFGYIEEIKVAQFVKATGIDMIVGYRLLKNDIDANEYILMTDPCCSAVGREPVGRLAKAAHGPHLSSARPADDRRQVSRRRSRGRRGGGDALASARSGPCIRLASAQCSG